MEAAAVRARRAYRTDAPALRNVPHVRRALTGVASALLDVAALDAPRLAPPSGPRMAALLAHAGVLDVVQQRQLALFEFTVAFVHMPVARYNSLDIGLHCAVLEALVRYELEWLAWLRRVELNTTSTIDGELVASALGRAVATVAVAYDWSATSSLTSRTALTDVLSALATGASVVPAQSVRDTARLVRIAIRQRLQFALTDAVFLVRVGTAAYPSLALDTRGAGERVTRLLVAADGVAQLRDLVLVGYPRIEGALAVLLSRSERVAAVFDAHAAFHAFVETALALVGSELPPRDNTDDTASMLAAPLWFVLVALSWTRVVVVVHSALVATTTDRAQFTRVFDYLDERAERAKHDAPIVQTL